MHIIHQVLEVKGVRPCPQQCALLSSMTLPPLNPPLQPAVYITLHWKSVGVGGLLPVQASHLHYQQLVSLPR